MNYNKKSVEDIDVNGKKVLVRCDFNVPLDGDVITDPKRIVEALPTIKYLLAHNAKVILCSHLGRPKGEFNMKYSLAPVAAKLSELLGKNVTLAKDVIGEDAKAKAAALKEGEVLLLENVRFHKEEEKNDPEWSEIIRTCLIPNCCCATCAVNFPMPKKRPWSGWPPPIRGCRTYSATCAAPKRFRRTSSAWNCSTPKPDSAACSRVFVPAPVKGFSGAPCAGRQY